MIRAELPGDIDAIHSVHVKAFGREEEAALVDEIRLHKGVEISLVSEEAGEIKGHVLFSAATLIGDNTLERGAALAPVGVLPDCQGRGIGTRLIKRGLKVLQQRSCPLVVVLGEPDYYARFGFVPAKQYGLTSKYPEEGFMVLVFEESRMPKDGAFVKYRCEFENLK